MPAVCFLIHFLIVPFSSSSSFSFFYSSAYHLYLHSFPTRRSSDLLHLRLEEMLEQPQVFNNGLDLLAVERQCLLQLVEDADRKSTRLNSSHQIISYAVFCLKKKKTKNKIN